MREWIKREEKIKRVDEQKREGRREGNEKSEE